MSGLEFLLLAKGIALVKAHFAITAAHTATTTAAAHVPAAVAHKAATHVAQKGVQAAASAPTATQAAVTLGSTAGLAYGIASQSGRVIGSAQRKLGRHGIGNPGPIVEEIQEVNEMDVDEPLTFPVPAWTAGRKVRDRQVDSEESVTRIPRRPVPVRGSSNEKQEEGQRQVPVEASSNEKEGGQRQNQQRIQRARAGSPNAMRLEDQPYDMEMRDIPDANNAKSPLDFNGKVGKSLFMFFRLCEIVLTLTLLGFIAASMSENLGLISYGWPSSINGGSVFAVLVTLWSLGFLLYRIVMTFKPALDNKIMALSTELLTILLVFGGAMALTIVFVCEDTSTFCDNEITTIIIIWTLFGYYLFSSFVAHARILFGTFSKTILHLFHSCT